MKALDLVFIFSIFSVFSALQAQAQFNGEVHFSAQYGGTDFKQITPTVYDHDRSWEFSYNQGYSLGFKGGYRLGFLNVGLGFEGGWKEEQIQREDKSTGQKADYDYQIRRFLAGPFITISPFKQNVMHFYAGYDPYVLSTIIYADNKNLNPFRKEDEFTGTAYTYGIGFDVNNTLIRLLGRKITYDKIETNGTKHELPDSTYSTKMTTDEFVIQFGTTF